MTAPLPDETSWTMIRDATRGDTAARDEFARSYLPVVRGYLARRWRSSGLREDMDDAVQEVFVDLLDADGALARVDPSRPGGFRAFLWGVTSKVALRCETRRARRRGRDGALPDDVPAQEDGASTVFDREWARAVMKRAAERQRRAAALLGDDAVRRCDLLRLRFEEAMPIRDIAARWEVDADALHHEYARARREFREALRAEVAFHHAGPPGEVDAECGRLLALLR
jgi:RNA polymerase sigma-70 factor (ECF subfamily)